MLRYRAPHNSITKWQTVANKIYCAFNCQSIKLFDVQFNPNNELLTNIQQTVAISSALARCRAVRGFIKNSNTNFPSFMSESISDVKHIRKTNNVRNFVWERFR